MSYSGIQEERIMAIDFGSKRIGLALSDPLKIFSYPFKTIQNDSNLWENLNLIFKENSVVKVILGYPLKENGQKSESTHLVEDFKNELESRVNIPIVLWDERYSSDLAKANILQSVTSKKKRRDKGLVDRNAASIILQEYLNEIKQ